MLVLNRLWQAVHIVAAKRAVALLFTGHARVLHRTDDNWQVWPADEWVELSHTQPATGNDVYLHTIRHSICLPKILILNDYGALPMKEVRLNRQSVFERDGYRCQYCGRHCKNHELNLDHVIPKDRGGQMTWQNIVASCLSCNSAKANRSPREAGMRLLRRPKQPKSRPFVAYMIGQQIEEQWQSFLHLSDEQAEVEIIRSERLFADAENPEAATGTEGKTEPQVLVG